MAAVETAGILQSLNVDDETIKAIVSILESNADELHSNHPRALDATYLGGSEAGANLGYHTSLAHEHVVTAMNQMVSGLRGYTANVEHFHKNIDFADDLSATTSGKTAAKVEVAPVPTVLPTVAQSTSCTSAPDVTTNTSCTLPAENG